MSCCGENVLDPKVPKKLFSRSHTELFTLVHDDIDWHVKATDPVIENGSGESGGFLNG
jgi:hypothetical protein